MFEVAGKAVKAQQEMEFRFAQLQVEIVRGRPKEAEKCEARIRDLLEDLLMYVKQHSEMQLIDPEKPLN